VKSGPRFLQFGIDYLVVTRKPEALSNRNYLVFNVRLLLDNLSVTSTPCESLRYATIRALELTCQQGMPQLFVQLSVIILILSQLLLQLELLGAAYSAATDSEEREHQHPEQRIRPSHGNHPKKFIRKA